MQSGDLTVSGSGSTRVILRGQPRTVHVHFKHGQQPVPCNPQDDSLSWFVDHEDEDPRRHYEIPHIHRDRQWVLIINWEVQGIRDIIWTISF